MFIDEFIHLILPQISRLYCLQYFLILICIGCTLESSPLETIQMYCQTYFAEKNIEAMLTKNNF